MKKRTKLPVPRRGAGNVEKVDAKKVAAMVKIAERDTAAAQTPRQIKTIADRLELFGRLLKKVDQDCTDINSVVDAHNDSVRRGGEILRQMGERGERLTKGGKGTGRPAKNSRPKDGSSKPLTLRDMGFSESRSRKWLMAARLPVDLLKEYREKTDAQPDVTRSLADVIKLAKDWIRQNVKAPRAKSTTATIVRASCLDWLSLQDNCDLLLTDPLYSTEPGFTVAWLLPALAKVKSTGSAYVFVGGYLPELNAYGSIQPPPHLHAPKLLGWVYYNTKGPHPREKYFQNWQAVLHYRGVDAPPLDCPELNELDAMQEFNAPDGRLPDSHPDHRLYEWQKPIKLAEQYIRHSTKPGDLVLDPFAGSGTFILAAAKLKRIGRGCDINEEAIKKAVQRGCVMGDEATKFDDELAMEVVALKWQVDKFWEADELQPLFGWREAA